MAFKWTWNWILPKNIEILTKFRVNLTKFDTDGPISKGPFIGEGWRVERQTGNAKTWLNPKCFVFVASEYDVPCGNKGPPSHLAVTRKYQGNEQKQVCSIYVLLRLSRLQRWLYTVETEVSCNVMETFWTQFSTKSPPPFGSSDPWAYIFMDKQYPRYLKKCTPA